MVSSRIRMTLISVLTVSLLITIVRQVFDLIGRLWLAIFINFIHSIATIIALFGVVQYRICLMNISLLWNCIYIGYNVFVICFYLQTGFIDRTARYLSVGIEQSYSFWLRYSPMCSVQYNLTSGQWIQDTNQCMVPYYYVEVAQAGVHCCFSILIILLIFILLITLINRNRNKIINDSDRKQPTITVQFSDPSGRGVVTALDESTSSGYLNSSFDQSPSLHDQHSFVPSIDTHGRLVQTATAIPPPPIGGYQRRQRGGTRGRRSDELISDNYSAAPTIEVTSRTNTRLKENVTFASLYTFSSEYRARSASPINRRRHITPMQQPVDERDQQQRHQRSSSVKSKSAFKQYAITNGVARIVANDDESTKFNDSTAAVLRNSTDSMLDNNNRIKRNSLSNLTSLISFDPKSNTLIRVREHQMNGSSENGTLNESEDSAPSVRAPPPINYDHQQQSSSHRVPSTVIGYEPALEASSGIYESVLHRSNRRSPPPPTPHHNTGHYHVPNNARSNVPLMAYDHRRPINENHRNYQRLPATVPTINDQSLLV